MDSRSFAYIDEEYVAAIIQLCDANKAMSHKIKELEQENTELKYRPGGIGYEQCKKEFEDLAANK